ncbi:hypothetical protein DMC30DRAFT_17166 [Rhodotorula diobovata]|uniref:Uncharacterized protein n=1 Tax=Rhodotorula diobovata TaxID=5288 RepID=A0A5C5FSF7_9BASI|nr:hypothetical protein DMC30DRAFT_17166 [Rhodotorula diobovata]
MAQDRRASRRARPPRRVRPGAAVSWPVRPSPAGRRSAFRFSPSSSLSTVWRLPCRLRHRPRRPSQCAHAIAFADSSLAPSAPCAAKRVRRRSCSPRCQPASSSTRPTPTGCVVMFRRLVVAVLAHLSPVAAQPDARPRRERLRASHSRGDGGSAAARARRSGGTRGGQARPRLSRGSPGRWARHGLVRRPPPSRAPDQARKGTRGLAVEEPDASASRRVRAQDAPAQGPPRRRVPQARTRLKEPLGTLGGLCRRDGLRPPHRRPRP